MIIRILFITLTCGCSFFYFSFSSAYNREIEKLAAIRTEVESSPDSYWQHYRTWSALPVDKQFQQPWGQAPYGAVSEEQKGQYQKRHLYADMRRLISGQLEPGPFASQIYGKDWKTTTADFVANLDHIHILQVRTLAATLLSGLVFSALMTLTLVKTVRLKFRRNAGETETITVITTAGPATARDETRAAITAAKQTQPAEISQTDQRHETAIAMRKQLQYHTSECWTQQTPAGHLAKSNWNHSISDMPEQEAAAIEKTTPAVKPPQELAGPAILPATPAAVAVVKPEPSGGGKAPAEDKESHLGKLSEELSALREYASRQQTRVEKLQDGYDWNILKNFCLRIIRCIDNLETQLEKHARAGEDVTALQNTYDELVFALESSGIEQFRPELKTPYQGQEKLMELFKQKEPCPYPELDGCIAAVIRPGYQYIVGSNQTKIVRMAQVKLYQLEPQEALA